MTLVDTTLMKTVAESSIRGDTTLMAKRCKDILYARATQHEAYAELGFRPNEENEMYSEQTETQYLNSVVKANAVGPKCWRCQTPGDYAYGEVCGKCFHELHEDCFDKNGNWVG